MTNEMFCFQCEQTAGCRGCTGKAGVCGKPADVAKLQDCLTQALIELSSELDGKTPSEKQREAVINGLFATLTNVNFNKENISTQIENVRSLRNGKNSSLDLLHIWNADEDIRSLKSLILFGLRGMAAYAYHAKIVGYQDDEVLDFFFEGLRAIGNKEADMDSLLPFVLKVGEMNLKCMALLDKANTETYGMPSPITVPLKVEKGPFIVITGHDLKDLELLLEQTKNRGINIYTHGEMLPAHAYPKFRAYSHLKGNFGTAW